MDSVDPNNNTSLGEKCYSLRPRAAAKLPTGTEEEDEVPWKPRGRAKRRAKQKPAPLSKYRRKTANARERSRMREINEAFESLRRAVPHLSAPSAAEANSANEKLTKITTLRLAMKYIAALSQALQDPDFESDADSLLSDYTLTPPDSLTPTTFSDHSDLYDQLLYTSPKPLPQRSSCLHEDDCSRLSFYPSSQLCLYPADQPPRLPADFNYSLTPPSSSSLLDAELITDPFLHHTLVSTADFEDIPAVPSVDFEDLFIT